MKSAMLGMGYGERLNSNGRLLPGWEFFNANIGEFHITYIETNKV